MPTQQQVRDWSEGYRQAWVNADAAGVTELFTGAATYRSNIYEDPHRGTEGIAEYWSAVTAAQSDVDVRMGAPHIDGSKAVVEFWTNMAVDGEPVTLAGCLLLDFDDAGLCSALYEYWNFTDGTHHPPPGWGE